MNAGALTQEEFEIQKKKHITKEFTKQKYLYL
jgi:hypothetical protein